MTPGVFMHKQEARDVTWGGWVGELSEADAKEQNM